MRPEPKHRVDGAGLDPTESSREVKRNPLGPLLIDRRGSHDRDGRVLEVTQIAVADMLASAAGLVMGEGAEGVPVAIVRGLHWDAPVLPAAALVRPPEEDLFR